VNVQATLDPVAGVERVCPTRMDDHMRRNTLKLLCLLPILLTLSGCERFSSDRKKTIETHLAHAKQLYAERDYQGAIAAYKDLLRFEPQHADAHLQVALIYDRNLNDYLNAAYHYQQYLQSSNVDAGKMDLAKGFLENTRLQFAASIPNVSGQGSPELVKLRSENAALHRQVEDLKREIVRNRSKAAEPIRSTTEKPVSPLPPQPVVKSEPRPPPISKTYTVQKGDGIQAIAEKVYGDRRKWRGIVAANPKIKDPDRLVPGQILVLP